MWWGVTDGHILDLSGTLLSQGVSDNDTKRENCRLRGGRITLTFLDSGSAGIVLRRVAGQCDAIATGVERLVRIVLLLPLLGMLEKVKGETKTLTLCLDPAMCRPRFGNLMWCLLEDRLVQGWEPHQLLLIVLWHLVTCLEHSSFFRQSCLQRTSPGVRKWWCLPQKRKGPRRESSCSGKKCNLRTDCGSKRLVTLNRLPSLKQMQ